ncbi:hypothetical protein HBI56_179920 [Parastagonospora nodorum]|uniref:Uncharacterized protein n=1 Tax=Phaeosphaeria nodorum (strain SN15 / ATCC MYA-4574 / FGSC 10173) TaxID=321614 RepID=A0A7U2F9E5_PHANO|nr:hypothetical protein HBH56_185350 [Parastagonospora nodorum]QRD01112.1 hypothetical protein JI435_438900 [Parastagonospora nodorum SN15]KAH3925233.1 hypothetical protein HBH54_183220 [Parastagonospora nodorum]KAH3940644.1 hypothetical protein HBH53_214780 [Parastagonospora nodorum]KAH3992130.1 hypothetical protein HBI10_221560 [Parastagonospora nodorum]
MRLMCTACSGEALCTANRLVLCLCACEDEHNDTSTPPAPHTKAEAAETVGLASQHMEDGVSRLFDHARSEAWPKLEIVHLTQCAWCCISVHKCGQWLQGRKLVCVADAQKVEGSF